MFYNAKNGNLKIGNTDMDYISFGTGKRILIMIPGLGDGMMTVKGKALPFAWAYRMFSKDFTVYLFSRKNELEEGCSIRDMAKDLKIAMDKLGIKKADIMGVSQGGMIAEYMAIDYPEVVNKLILVVTVGRQNECIQSNVKRWIALAEQNRYGEAMKDIMVRMYTNEYIQKYRIMLNVVGLFPGPKNKVRFLRMAKSCIKHSLFEELKQIKAPTLIIGGERDETVTGEASREIAKQIKGSELYMYDDYGHGLYSEAEDFNQRVFDFLLT